MSGLMSGAKTKILFEPAEAPFSDPRISVAMATYNGEKFLAEQLESLQQQTKLPHELVIIDDGSSDRTMEIIAVFAETSLFPVRIFKNGKNLGYQITFLTAASHCQGDLIAFCDQDDVWLPNKLEICAASFTDPDIVLCFHMGEVWSGQARGTELAQRFANYGVFPPFSFDPLKSVLGFSMVFRRSLLWIVSMISLPPSIYNVMPGPKKTMIGHDGLVWFLACIFGKTAIIPDILVLYRQHGGNAVGKDRRVSLLGQLREIFAFWDLAALVRLEGEYTAFLEAITAQGAAPVKAQAQAMIKILSERMSFHVRRAKLFEPENNIFARSALFIKLLVSGQYAKAYCFDQFNRYARTSDFLFGVLRLKPLVERLRSSAKAAKDSKPASVAE